MVASEPRRVSTTRSSAYRPKPDDFAERMGAADGFEDLPHLRRRGTVKSSALRCCQPMKVGRRDRPGISPRPNAVAVTERQEVVGDVAGQVDILETVAIEAHGIDEVGTDCLAGAPAGRRAPPRTAGRLAEKRDGRRRQTLPRRVCSSRTLHDACPTVADKVISLSPRLPDSLDTKAVEHVRWRRSVGLPVLALCDDHGSKGSR